MPNETKPRTGGVAANLLLLAATFLIFFIVLEAALRITAGARKTGN